MAGSITHWLHLLRAGENEPVANLWRRWFSRLCNQVAPYTKSLAICDEEDVALSAIHDLCESIKDDKYPNVADRNELWRLLSVIAMRKARDWRKYDTAEKRGGSVATHSYFENLNGEPSSATDFEHQFQEHLRTLMNCLGDAELKNVVRLRLLGHTNHEIAQNIGCSRRTVQYMLKRIREAWANIALAD